MRHELSTYFEDTGTPAGLLIAEAPTGYGKTFEAVQAMFRYVRGGGRSQILFATNLLKNLPAEELRRAYREAGLEDLFAREVLTLSSTADAVEEALLARDTVVPPEFQTEAYQALLSACRKKQKCLRLGGEESADIVSYLSEQIRVELEPRFRHELERHLRQRFPEGPGQRRTAIREDPRYQWMARCYPGVFWGEYRILLLSVKKLMARMVPLVEPGFDLLSDRMLEGRIVCIDEFDASRAVILDSLIEQALNLRADYLQLFLQVYLGATSHQISRELENARRTYESGRTLKWADLLEQAGQIFRDGALHYSMKTVDTVPGQGRNFLFHDTSYHTVLDNNRTYIRAVRSDEHAQVQIHFETRAEYDAHRGEPRIRIQNLLRRIHRFLLRFQRYVYGWAACYARQINGARRREEEQYTMANAAETIFRDYGLTPAQVRLMTGGLRTEEPRRSAGELAAPNLSFYETGFRLFEFTDDDRHRAQTYLQYLQMDSTPEQVLLYLCRRAKVVGLSATAELPTVLGNYDLRYLREQLGEGFRTLSQSTRDHIRRHLEELWTPYRDGRIRVDLQVVDRGKKTLPLQDRLEELFTSPDHARKYYMRLTALSGEAYIRNRYCNLFAAMRAFWTRPDLHAFLCLQQVLPAPGKPAMDLEVLTDALEDLRQECAPRDCGALVVLRSGSQFEGAKEELLQALARGEKRFVLSSYQTLGAGQNLQFPVAAPAGLVMLGAAPPDGGDSRFRSKDFDGLYLGDVTHAAVNLNGDEPLREAELMKFCFQVECLYQNDEISYHTLTSLLRDGISRFSGRPLSSPAQSQVQQCASLRGLITRDVLQAVGRIARTFLKRPSVSLFTTEYLLGKLDPACLEGRLLSPEMESLYRARLALGVSPARPDTARWEAERKATRGKAYIMQMLHDGWSEESMALWKALRRTVLTHPRASQAVWERDPVVRTYYIPLPEEVSRYCFAQKGDFSQVYLSLDGDAAGLAAGLEEELPVSTVSEEEARLSALLAYPGMREHFAEHGWATQFPPGPYILSPVLFQNIYKGALGEVAGRFILQRELGLALSELEDPRHFEAFDFRAGDGLFFDFKHWKSKTWMDEDAMRTKALEKLDAVGGRTAFLINLIWDGASRPACTADGRLVEIPGLLLPDGRPHRDALVYLRGYLL